jgi:hypothetical protein
MSRLSRLALAALVASTTLAVAPAATAQKKAIITTTVNGTDLEITLKGVTDYCSTHADTQVIRNSESIRIIRERPTRPSRCFSSDDVKFVVHDVAPGTYNVSYEQVPLVAPARPLRIAWTTTTIP